MAEMSDTPQIAVFDTAFNAYIPPSVDELGIPTEFAISQNYPNPFNMTTTIQHSLTKESNVIISIFNAIGQVVRRFDQGFQQPGNYKVAWDCKDNQGHHSTSGLYLYQIIADGFVNVKSMVLVK